MKKIIYSLLFLGSLPLILIGCDRSPGQRADFLVKKISSKLDLDEIQKTKLIELKDAFQQARKRHQADKNAMRSEVKQLLLSDKISENSVKDLIAKKERIVGEEFPVVFAKFQDFHASLSKEQKEEAVALIEKFRKKRGRFSRH